MLTPHLTTPPDGPLHVARFVDPQAALRALDALPGRPWLGLATAGPADLTLYAVAEDAPRCAQLHNALLDAVLRGDAIGYWQRDGADAACWPDQHDRAHPTLWPHAAGVNGIRARIAALAAEAVPT